MKVYFYTNFAKKENSTKRPVTEGTGAATQYEIEGNLKEPCSVLFPVISLQTNFAGQNIPPIAGYAYIPKFYRYYFVKDWTWTDGTWTVQLSVDVLASWKSIIGQESEYILRTDSAGAAYNGLITDTAYPATCDFERNIHYSPNCFSSDLSVGCYVVGIISGGTPTTTGSVGAITYYAMDASEFGALKETLFSEDNLKIMEILDSQGQQIVTDLSQEVLKTLYNPYQYIVSCTWFPFMVTDIPDTESVTDIPLGWWSYPLTGAQIYAQTVEFAELVSINNHPQAATRGAYLNYAPYTKRTLIGRFGTVALDNSLFKDIDNIGIGYLVDLITGQCRATIEIKYSVETYPHSDPIAERNFLLGVPIQIAQVGTDYLGVAANAIGGVGGAIGGGMSGYASGGAVGAVAGVISGAVSGIYNTVRSAMPVVETMGANGSFISCQVATEMIEEFYKIVDEDIAHKGRPLCEIRRIDTLSGFIMCAEGDMDLDVYEEERTAIRNYLTTGFFWE